jgi:hypothetical protein
MSLISIFHFSIIIFHWLVVNNIHKITEEGTTNEKFLKSIDESLAKAPIILTIKLQ